MINGETYNDSATHTMWSDGSAEFRFFKLKEVEPPNSMDDINLGDIITGKELAGLDWNVRARLLLTDSIYKPDGNGGLLFKFSGGFTWHDAKSHFDSYAFEIIYF